MRLIGIYGAGGAGRGIIPLIAQQIADDLKTKLVFIDDGDHPSEINGYPVLSWSDFISAKAAQKLVSIAISNSKIREEIAQKCITHDISFTTIIASNAVMMDNVTMGEGAIISPFCCITSNITIGNHFHANIGSYVEHDCVIGDFVTFAPKAACNGNVHIGNHAYIGTGAVIRQGTNDKPLEIGAGAIIGMGAVVTKNVPAGEIWVGNPARFLRKA